MRISRKNILFLLMVIMLSIKTFSQQSFIVNNDNEKIIVDDHFFDIQISNENIEYKTPDNDDKQTIKFKNINSALLGEYDIKRMKIADEKNEQLCFTVAQSKGKKLIGYNKIIHMANTGANLDQGGGTMIKFIYYILDENNKVIEKIETYSLAQEKYAKLRQEAENKIKKHFSDCKEVVDRLSGDIFKKRENIKYSKTMGKMLDRMVAMKGNVEMFFETPIYTNCDAPKQPDTSIAQAAVAIPEQKYYYEKISSTAMGNGTKTTDYSMKGTIVIKDNSFSFFTKNVDATYKIISYENRVMKCDDNGNIHIVTIESEAGKKGNFVYDTKVTLVADKKMGGSTSFYWCKKQ